MRGIGSRFGSSLREASRPRLIAVAAAVLLVVVACADRVTRRSTSRDAADRRFDRKTALVTHVADGDTIEIDFDDRDPPLRVRLLGIDAPELGNAAGEASKRYLLARAADQRVTIRLDTLGSTRDKYDRLLAYVYLPNHELLNNALVRDGQAFAYRPKKCEFSSLFETSEGQARSKKTGLWKSITVHEMPEWRQRWMRERGLK